MAEHIDATCVRTDFNKRLGNFTEIIDVSNDVKIVTIDISKAHVCAICGIAYAGKYDLKKHIITHKLPGEKPYQCNKCDYACKEYSSLEKHMKTHTSLLPYKCTHCNKSFNQEHRLAFHISTHTGKKPYHCDQCDIGFTKSIEFKKHLRTHRIVTICSICDKKFVDEPNLLRHMKSEHNTSGPSWTPHQCSLCSKSFDTLYRLERHLLIHTGERPFNCSICDKGFCDKGRYLKHLEFHRDQRTDRDKEISKLLSEGITESHMQTDTDQDADHSTDDAFKEETEQSISDIETKDCNIFDKKSDKRMIPSDNTQTSTSSTSPTFQVPELDINPKVIKKKKTFRAIVRDANINVGKCSTFSQAYALACLSEKGDAMTFQRIMKQYSVANNLPVVIHPRPDKEIIDFYSDKIVKNE